MKEKMKQIKMNNKKIKLLVIILLFLVIISKTFAEETPTLTGYTDKHGDYYHVITYPSTHVLAKGEDQVMTLNEDLFKAIAEWQDYEKVFILKSETVAEDMVSKEAENIIKFQAKVISANEVRVIEISTVDKIGVGIEGNNIKKKIMSAKEERVIASLDITKDIKFSEIGSYDDEKEGWNAKVLSNGNEVEGIIKDKTFTSNDGTIKVEETKETIKTGPTTDGKVQVIQIKETWMKDESIIGARIDYETDKTLEIDEMLKVTDISYNPEEEDSEKKWTVSLKDEYNGKIIEMETRDGEYFSTIDSTNGNTIIINVKENILHRAEIEKNTGYQKEWQNNNLIYATFSDSTIDISKEISIKWIEKSGKIYKATKNDGREGTLSEDGKIFKTYDHLYTIEYLGNNKIQEKTFKSEDKSKIDTLTIKENSNIISYQKENTELKFNKLMEVEKVEYDDSINDWTATLSDGTICNVEDNGNKLVSRFKSFEIVKDYYGQVIGVMETTGIGTDNQKTFELNEAGQVVSVETVNEGKIDIPFLIDKNLKNLITDKVIKDIKSGEYKDMKVENGKITYTSSKPTESSPASESTTPVGVKNWKIIDSQIDSNTDEGTTTIMYGDGKYVTMRTEMLTTIAPELNMIEDFDEIKVEGNILTYTTKGDDSYNAVIEFNDDGTKKSKTYTKTNSDGKITAQTIYEFDENGEVKSETHVEQNKDGTYTTTVKDKDGNVVVQPETEISGEVKLGAGISAEGSFSIDTDEIWSNKIGIKLKNVHEEDGVFYATLEDGSKGTLSEEENKFIYDDSGEGVIHTLQAIEGESLLEYYKDESEDYGTIKISIDKGNNEKEDIIFEGIYDEDKKIIKKGKEIIAEIDENGRILTDFNKNGVAQTIHYPANIFGIYVFGKIQKDDSEKIFRSGYIPVAFVTENGKIVIIKQDEEGYFYTDAQGNKLSENSAGVKEAKAMVTKSLIGPAFYAAMDGARGGIALSNLLNSWLDWDFMMGWRKTTDEFFSQTVIGRIISGKWEESVCHKHIDKIPNNIAVVNVNNVMGFAAHVEGERSAAITTSNETSYFYKITFGVNPRSEEDIEFELLIDGNKADLDNDGTADKIKIEAGESYSGKGENAVVRYKDEVYEKVCLKFYDTENLNAEFRNSLNDDKLCNNIVEAYISPGEISKPASNTTISVSGTSDGW